MVRRHVVHLEQQQARFDPRQVERQHAARRDPVGRAGVHHGVPERQGLLGIHPHLETQVAGVAGARDRDRDAADGSGSEAVVLEDCEVGRCQHFEDGARARALQCQGGCRGRHVLDLHVQARGVEVQPAEIGIGGRKAERLLAQARDRAVVDDLAGRVAPRRVQHLTDLRLPDVAGDDAIEQPFGVGAGDQVLVQR